MNLHSIDLKMVIMELREISAFVEYTFLSGVSFFLGVEWNPCFLTGPGNDLIDLFKIYLCCYCDPYTYLSGQQKYFAANV